MYNSWKHLLPSSSRILSPNTRVHSWHHSLVNTLIIGGSTCTSVLIGSSGPADVVLELPGTALSGLGCEVSSAAIKVTLYFVMMDTANTEIRLTDVVFTVWRNYTQSVKMNCALWGCEWARMTCDWYQQNNWPISCHSCKTSTNIISFKHTHSWLWHLVFLPSSWAWV